MLVLTYSLLTALGCKVETTTAPFPCPMHPHTEPSLRDIVNSGVTTFNCQHCKFNGDAIDLVTKARGLPSADDAAKLFLPGNELSTTLQYTLSETQLQSYRNGRRSQVHIHDYMHKCHMALSTTAGQHLKAELTRDHRLYDRLPTTLGVMQTDRVPPGLHKLEKSFFKKDIYGIYAYEYDSTITAVTIRAVNSGHTEMIPLVADDRGVYLENNLPAEPTHIIIVQNEELATELYTLGVYYSSRPFPVVAVRGYPLSNKYRTLKHIYMLSTGDSPLSLEKAIQTFATPQIIAGATYRPPISVITTKEPSIDPMVLVNVQASAVRLEQWIADQLSDYHQRRGMAAVYRLLQHLPAFGAQVELISSLLQQMAAPQELLEGIRQHSAKYDKRVMLSSGVCVCRTPLGYSAAHSWNEEPSQILSNFTFDVTQILHTGRPVKLLYRCTVKPEHGQALDMILSQRDFTRSQLQQAIVSEYLEAGYTLPKIICTSRTDVNWAEVRDMFNDPEKLQTVEVVQVLGVSRNLILELPQLSITEHGTKIIPQTKIIPHRLVPGRKNLKTSPDSPTVALDLYRGIRPFKWTQPHLKPFIKLWQSDQRASMALSACISQLAFCIMSNLAHQKIAGKMERQHLLFVDASYETWEAVLKQFMFIISGSDTLLRPQRTLTWFARYSALGDLPLVFAMPPISSDRDCKYLAENTKLNWIAAVDPDFGQAVSDLKNVIYVSYPRSTAGRKVKPADDDLVTDLQAALPELLQCIVNQAWDIPAGDYNASTNPIIDTHKFIADMLCIKQYRVIHQFVHTTHQPVPKTRKLRLLSGPEAKVEMG